LCTLEFQDNRRIYDWILENLDEFNKPDRPHQYEFSRLNLEYTVMSKRLLQKIVEDELVSGWNDPRMPTISGLRRRGYTAKSIRDFADRIGISKVDSTTDISILESSVRDDLNITAPRTMAVIDPVMVVIENYHANKVESIYAPIHPQNESMGKREIFFGRKIFIDRADFQETTPNNKYKRLSIDKEVRLRNSYVINAKSFDTDIDGNISTIYATYDPETLGKNPLDGRKVKGVIHFVEATKSVEAEFRIYDRLFTIQNPASVENFEDIINPNSLVAKFGVVEPYMSSAKPGFPYQFEREGYFCRDSGSNKSVIFNKTVGLRDTWNK
jgi:glutaminyl-tRNA synthetase